MVPQIIGIRNCLLCNYHIIAVTLIKAGFEIQMCFVLSNIISFSFSLFFVKIRVQNIVLNVEYKKG